MNVVIVTGASAEEIAALVLAVQERQENDIFDRMANALKEKINPQAEQGRLFQ